MALSTHLGTVSDINVRCRTQSEDRLSARLCSFSRAEYLSSLDQSRIKISFPSLVHQISQKHQPFVYPRANLRYYARRFSFLVR